MPRILVIEDDTQVRTMLCQTLKRAGYETIEACNGDVAIKLYDQSPADLIITDIIMPEREGIETIRRFQDQYPETKIIAISGGGQHLKADEWLAIAKKFGASCTLTKPFEQKEILTTIEMLLR